MVVTIIGARPQFIKAAAVSIELGKLGVEERIVHTGQHYDKRMSAIFWEELGIPEPSINLAVGSCGHAEQTGKIVIELSRYLDSLSKPPKGLLLYGDTNSTLAGAIVGSKIKDLSIFHVESGLRSFDKSMPEEVNRIMTDHVSDVLFCSSNVGVEQLNKECIDGKITEVGDVMYDAMLRFSQMALKRVKLSTIVPNEISEFILLTIHRPSNTDNVKKLKNILEAINRIKVPMIWPVHPRVRSQLMSMSLPKNLILKEPFSYLQMLRVLGECKLVMTDSGGLQKEAYWKKKKCITLRNSTEWVETLHGSWNTLVGSDTKKILKAYKSVITTEWTPIYGSGNASRMIAQTILSELNENEFQRKV